MFVKETSSRRRVLHASYSFKSIFYRPNHPTPQCVSLNPFSFHQRFYYRCPEACLCACACMNADACLCRFTVRLQRFLQHGGSVRSGSVRRPAINCSSGITKWEEMLNNHCTLHWLKRPSDHLKATLGFFWSVSSPSNHRSIRKRLERWCLSRVQPQEACQLDHLGCLMLLTCFDHGSFLSHRL